LNLQLSRRALGQLCGKINSEKFLTLQNFEMSNGSDQDPSKIIRQSSSSDSSIQPSEQSDLLAINEYLTERIKSAKTPEEIREYLTLRDYVQSQALKQFEQETVKFKLQQAKDEIRFNRKLKVAREVRTLAASTVTTVIGLYLVANSPVFGAMLIILGLAKPLEYSLNEISDLFKNLSELLKQLPDLLLGNKKNSESDQGNGDKSNGGKN
jgi:hypothetical protein